MCLKLKLANVNNIENFRNIGISAHIDAGKTTITERILYYTGINYKIGEVHDGEATMDWMDQEQERGITISSAATTVFWNGSFKNKNFFKINIIDTPGHVDFTIEVERSMRVIDGACMVYCGVSGIQSQSETVWKQSKKYNVSKIIFVNKMDRIGSDFFKIHDSLKLKFNANPVPIFIPYFFNNSFNGVIDLINFKLISWNNDDNGMSFDLYNIPSDFLESSLYWRENMIEKSIDGDDFLINKYINNIEITNDELLNILRFKTVNCQIQPMICGSAFKNKGVQCLLDSIVDFLPSPLDLNNIKGESLNGEIIFRKSDIKEDFSCLVFKIMNDSFIGQLAFIRIYSGVLNCGDLIFNPLKNKKEKISRILRVHADKKEDIKHVTAGDIVAVSGLKNINTGDTLCSIKNPILLERISFPEPVISRSIEIKNKLDQEKINNALLRFSQEDPSFIFKNDPLSNQIIISGMGELHLEILIERIKREFDIILTVGDPKVSYKETIKNSVKNIEGKYIRQSGGRGQYGHVVINLEPNIRGGGYKFVNNIKGGVIPKEYISVIDRGIKESLDVSGNMGYPVTDVIVFLIDGSYHEVDSSENAFKIASSIAFKEGIKKSSSILLEPIMSVEIEFPFEYLGSIISDLSSRKGVLVSIEDLFDNYKIISCNVPLSNMFNYSTVLRSLTKGRGVYNMSFKNYSESF